MIKKLFLSISIQSIGTLSSFALVWLITHYLGLEKQGEFAILKSWIDLWIVIGCFGLPQGFIYAINKLKAPIQPLKKFSTYYPIALIFITTIASFIWFRLINKSITLLPLQYLLIGIAIAGIVGHGLLRGIYLTQNDGNLFAFVSILPALSLFLLTIITTIISKNVSFPEIYILSGCLSFAIVFPLIKTHETTQKQIIPWQKIIANGNSVFLQGLAVTLLPVCTYWLMHEFDMTQKEIGGFNIAMYFYLAIALPLNMIAPIFFNRWSKTNENSLLKQELKKFISIGIWIIPFSLLLFYFTPHIIMFFFGKETSFIITTAQVFILSSIIIYLNNILSCMNLSIGNFTKNSIYYISKNVLTIFFVFIALKLFSHELIYIAYSWALGDIILLGMLSISIKQFFKNKRTTA